MYPARSKTKKSAATATDDPVEFTGVCGECYDGHNTRRSWHQRVIKHQLQNKVKLEPTYPNLVAGEVICPGSGCMMKIYVAGGCKSITCRNCFVRFCGHCRLLSPDDDIPKCNCPFSFEKGARLRVHKTRSQPFIRLDEDDDDTSNTATPNESTESPSDTANDSESTGSEYGDSDPDYVPSPTSEDQDVTGGEDRSLAGVSHTIKQEPDVAKSSTYDVKTAYDETGPTPDAVKSEEVLFSLTVYGNQLMKNLQYSPISNQLRAETETETEMRTQTPDYAAHGFNPFDNTRCGLRKLESRIRTDIVQRIIKENPTIQNPDNIDWRIYYDEFKRRWPYSYYCKWNLFYPTMPPNPMSEQEFYDTYTMRMARKFKDIRKEERKRAAPVAGAAAAVPAPATAVDDAKIKSEDSSGNDDEKKDEGAASSNAEDGEEEDYAALIYQDSQRRKREAAAIAASSKKRRKTSSTSTGKTAATASAAKKKRASAKRKRQSDEGEEKAATPVAKKKHRYECSAEGCTNHAVRGGVCIKHGAKIDYKRCSVEGCTNHIVKGGVCIKHGAKKELKLCSSEGCTNQVVKGGVCKRHGAKKEHKRCSSEGCKNQAQKGGVCMRHGAKVKIKLCSSEGCTNLSVKGGVCIRHGAKVTRCSSEGCTNHVVKGGVCWRHGANLL